MPRAYPVGRTTSLGITRRLLNGLVGPRLGVVIERVEGQLDRLTNKSIDLFREVQAAEDSLVILKQKMAQQTAENDRDRSELQRLTEGMSHITDTTDLERHHEEMAELRSRLEANLEKTMVLWLEIEVRTSILHRLRAVYAAYVANVDVLVDLKGVDSS